MEFLCYLVPFLKYEWFNFRIFDSAPYSLLKNDDPKKVFCTQSNVKCLILKIFSIFFSAESWYIKLASCVYLSSIRVKLTVWWDCKVGQQKNGQKRLLGVTGLTDPSQYLCTPVWCTSTLSTLGGGNWTQDSQLLNCNNAVQQS